MRWFALTQRSDAVFRRYRLILRIRDIADGAWLSALAEIGAAPWAMRLGEGFLLLTYLDSASVPMLVCDAGGQRPEITKETGRRHSHVVPNTHRRRDSTRQLRRVGGVYWA